MWRRLRAALGPLAVILLQACGPSPAPPQREVLFDPVRGSLLSNQPQPIYDPDPSHAWNRLFHLLFTRTLEVRRGAVTGWPVFSASDERTPVSTRTVTRIEGGDGAIDPLYPSWVWLGGIPEGSPGGGEWILRDPRYAELVRALEEVIATAPAWQPLPRALMQADLWAAFDLLSAEGPALARRASRDLSEPRQRADHVLRLLANAIRALALTPSEIAALPDTFARARSKYDVPDLFNPESGWVEIRWFDTRMHERAVQDRRAARVFVKPAFRPADLPAFLNRFRDGHGAHFSALDAAALLIQSLLIASDGAIVPSPITYEVQLRRFHRDPASSGPEVLQYELSRQLLLASPESDGFRALDEYSPSYLPSAGNDLSFATPSLGRSGADKPVLVPLRQRCISCHGPLLDHLVTFSMTSFREPPPVVALDALQHTHVMGVAARKAASESYALLRRLWEGTR